MARKKIKSYPESFRREAVHLADQPDRTATDVAAVLGCFPVLILSNIVAVKVNYILAGVMVGIIAFEFAVGFFCYIGVKNMTGALERNKI